jgi:hypothetical protein
MNISGTETILNGELRRNAFPFRPSDNFTIMKPEENVLNHKTNFITRPDLDRLIGSTAE